jgi:hypothetical protein
MISKKKINTLQNQQRTRGRRGKRDGDGIPEVYLQGDVAMHGSCAVPQHGVKLDFGNGELVWCQSLQSAGDRWARSSPDVVDSIMANFALDSSWASEVQELSKEAVNRCCQ